mmetsp:Transcript_109419/g.172494  ORF Transcript_109419/g.172494 Transcript_109419/m.172494 type:complete len:755 (-) Transcript_109419:107-2371(-)
MRASVAIIALVGPHLLGTTTAVRAVRITTKTKFKGATTTEVSWPLCSNAVAWAEEKRDKGMYLPSTHSFFSCRLGYFPTSVAYQQFRASDKCGSYYVEKLCKVRNEPYIQAMKTYSMTDGSGKCVEPEFTMRDCTDLQDAVLRVDAATNDKEREATTFALAEKVAYMVELSPNNQWMQIPSHKLAVSRLAASLEEMIANSWKLTQREYHRLVGRKLGPVWRVLLSYCADAAARALDEIKSLTHRNDHYALGEESAEQGEAECMKTTKIDLFAKYHPAAISAKEEFANLDSLNSFGSIGLEHLAQKPVWDQLAKYAGVSDAGAFEKFAQKKNELVLNAGDRGEYELELALAYHNEDSNLPAPTGGQRRLDELRMDKELKQVAELGRQFDKITLQRLIDQADKLLSEGDLLWVPVDPFMEAKRLCQNKLRGWGMAEQCEAAGLPPTCTQQDIDNAACAKVGLPLGCTSEDIRKLQARQQECVALGLSPECSDSDIAAEKERRNKCRLLKLSITCTEEEINNLLALRRTCERLGIAEEDCSQDHVDQKEALMKKCVAAKLPGDCTQEDLDKVVLEEPVIEVKPKPFCAVRERTSLTFGVQFAYHVHGECNKVTCQPLVFFQKGGDIGKYMSFETGDRNKCSCFAHVDGEKNELLSFVHPDCGVSKCWERYSESMEAKYPDRQLPPYQKLAEMDHWEAECVEEHEAEISIPKPPKASTGQRIRRGLNWPPQRESSPKLLGVVEQFTSSVSNMRKNFEK